MHEKIYTFLLWKKYCHTSLSHYTFTNTSDGSDVGKAGKWDIKLAKSKSYGLIGHIDQGGI